MTLTEKETTKKVVTQERLAVIKFVNKFCQDRKRLEAEYDKFMSEILKYSKDFVLNKKQRTYSRDLEIPHNGTRITIDTISEVYNECSIDFVGKLPNDRSNSIHITVEEHRTYSRSGWSSTNHGVKLKLNFNYDKEIWYKSARSFVNKVNEFVESKWENFKYEQERLNKKTLAMVEASKKFDGALVSHKGGNELTVTYPNGVNAGVTFRFDENHQITFKVNNVKFGNNVNQDKLIDLITKLGN